MRRYIALLVAVLVVACTNSGSTTTTVTPETTQPTSTDAGSTSTTGGDTGPLDTRLQWLAAALSRGEIPASEYEATFTSDFLGAVSHDEFVSGLSQLGGGGQRTWSVGEFEDRQDVTATVLLVSDTGEELRAHITIENAAPYRISGLRLQPAEPPTLENPPATLDDAAAQLGDLGTLELAVYDVTEGECNPLFESGTGDPMPIGSAFKLYVLGALADAVSAGEVAWDNEIAISEDHRSVPTGVLQDEEAGAEFSVRQVAETMIAFSDNTGTDHLIALLGRRAVEAAFQRYGMEDPSLNIPLMDTMDLTALKLGPASGLAEQWIDADESGRRAILDQISDIHPSDIPLAEWDRPIHVDTIEWFASTADMCRVLVALVEQGEPVTNILSINPGIPDEEGRFEAIYFKGGAEVGLTAMNWLVELRDGRRFVVSGSVYDTESDVDQLMATLLFGAVRDLVADL
ncbi:MAG TPA: serine hydrolase [Acidimicrobiia bacterium]|jgi:hypothetical protein